MTSAGARCRTAARGRPVCVQRGRAEVGEERGNRGRGGGRRLRVQQRRREREGLGAGEQVEHDVRLGQVRQEPCMHLHARVLCPPGPRGATSVKKLKQMGYGLGMRH